MTSQAKTINQSPDWPDLIYDKRCHLGETQTQFGERFGVSHAAVSDWERGITDPPGTVTWWLVNHGDFFCKTEVPDA